MPLLQPFSFYRYVHFDLSLNTEQFLLTRGLLHFIVLAVDQFARTKTFSIQVFQSYLINKLHSTFSFNYSTLKLSFLQFIVAFQIQKKLCHFHCLNFDKFHEIKYLPFLFNFIYFMNFSFLQFSESYFFGNSEIFIFVA